MAYLVRTLVRERRALRLEELIKKVTQFPARRMGLDDRGVLSPGKRADVVLFDAARLTDRATMTDPCRYSEGTVWSFVNGRPVIANGLIFTRISSIAQAVRPASMFLCAQPATRSISNWYQEP